MILLASFGPSSEMGDEIEERHKDSSSPLSRSYPVFDVRNLWSDLT